MGHGGGGRRHSAPPDDSSSQSGSDDGSSLRETLARAQTLEIRHEEPRLSIIDANGRERVVYTDGRKTEEERSAGGTTKVRARWKDGRVEVTSVPEKGPKITETFSVTADRTQLMMTLSFERRRGGEVHAAPNLRRGARGRAGRRSATGPAPSRVRSPERCGSDHVGALRRGRLGAAAAPQRGDTRHGTGDGRLRAERRADRILQIETADESDPGLDRPAAPGERGAIRVRPATAPGTPPTGGSRTRGARDSRAARRSGARAEPACRPPRPPGGPAPASAARAGGPPTDRSPPASPGSWSRRDRSRARRDPCTPAGSSASR